MERRLIVFVTISLVIIFLYPVFITWVSGPVQPNLSPSIEDSAEESHRSDPEHRSGSEESPTAPSETPGPLNTPVEDPRQIEQERIHALEKIKVIESDLYRITLSNIGGTLKSWELKKYTKKNEDKTEERIQLIQDGSENLPLTLIMPGDTEPGKRVYQFEANPLQLSEGLPEGKVRMISIEPDGRKIIKELRFRNDTYLVDLSIVTEGYSETYDLSLGTNFGINEWNEQGGVGRSTGSIALVETEVLRNTPSKMESEKVVYEDKTKWFGLQDKYFISALIPRGDKPFGPVSIVKKDETALFAQIRVEGQGAREFSLYAGPKEYDRLSKLKVNLDESIDFGWFIFGSLLPVRLISKPIFYLLGFFYQFTHNYGVAIMMVTGLVKILFFPITKKSLQSMKSMSSIQPKVAAIRKQWGKDKEKMNKELINLYKTEKVNPLGGCLPMLLQIPVFISLYNILYTTIELRQAPFFAWVQDLSEPDPFYVLPIVMGATMFLQQYTQPSTMDPTQAKLMLFLPIVYTFFFLNFPSGLVLYWLVNNVLTITQQYLIKREDK